MNDAAVRHAGINRPDFIHRFEPADARAGSAVAARTLLLLHGTGGSEHDLIDLGRSLDPAAALLSPRGKVLENGMPRFFRRLREGVFDIPDLIARTHELADFVTASADQNHLDRSRLVAVGFSNGANIAAAMLLLRPDVLAGAILLRPMVPLKPDADTQANPDARTDTRSSLAGKPVLILSGNADPIVPPDHPDTLARLLTGRGAAVTLHRLPASHNLTQQDLALAASWLAH